MSSKKVASKETKAAKKPAAKKTATASAAKKPAVKESASKTASKKPAKAAAKAAPKAPAKPAAKPVAKAVAKAAAKPVAKAPKAEAKPAKVAAKPAKANNAKAASKPAKVVAAKPAKAKVEEKVSAKPASTSKFKEKTNVKVEAPKGKAKAATSKKTPVSEPKVESKKGGKKSDNKVVAPVAEQPVAEVVKETKEVKEQPKFDYAILLEGVKKLSKSVMFTIVDEQEDRSNKKKMSSEMKNLEMKPTASIRHKASLAEETQEELTERILKELEEQNLAFEREAANQKCTRCNRNFVSPEFWVDKHLGYCEECASILKLGQSKEARKVEYQLGGMGDSLDEEDEDIMGPDADDLKEAEEDLAEMDD